MKKTALLLLIQILFFPTLSAQTASQTIRGTVTDRNSGQPVAYATVVVMDRQRALGTTTDSLGRFSLRQVPVGRHDVEVNCLGYEPTQLREILVGSSKEVVLDVRLQEALVAVEEVVVRPTVNKTEPLNSMALAGGRMLSVEEASRYAGSMDDPARLVSAFAGVASTVGNNGIVVRGNVPKFLLWRMEGVEIPNPNHFAEVTSFGGGGLTALSSQVLGNSDFYTGAFPAEYGNALSGVFDMYLRAHLPTGNPRYRCRLRGPLFEKLRRILPLQLSLFDPFAAHADAACRCRGNELPGPVVQTCVSEPPGRNLFVVGCRLD